MIKDVIMRAIAKQGVGDPGRRSDTASGRPFSYVCPCVRLRGRVHSFLKEAAQRAQLSVRARNYRRGTGACSIR